ncbi:MAG: hypothetical protein SNJ77_09780 [Cytophagales bacterium]
MNKLFFCFSLILIFLSQTGFTQTKDTLFNITYHNNKKISTKSVRFENNGIYWGYAKAFDREGKLIFNAQTRRVAGHASVHFTFHPNGMVKTAHYTSHPDGGIQWTDIKHHFDENGKETHVDDRSSDLYGRPTIHPTFKIHHEKEEIQPKREVEITKPVKQETITCAEVYETEVYLVNLSKRKTRFSFNSLVKMNNQLNSPIEIAVGDSLKLGSFTEAQMFTHPKERIKFELATKNIKVLWDEPQQISKTKRKYYAVLVGMK